MEREVSKSPIILALDTDSLDTAQRWIEATNSEISTYKAGLEFFLAHGVEGVSALRNAGNFDLFLDLKLHDIPNTVAGAVRSIKNLRPRFLTVHASGGSKMISAATEVDSAIAITAVTILTSLSDDDLNEIGFKESSLEAAVKLANIAVRSGASAIVCSPLEVEKIRRTVGEDIVLITPGVRPADSDRGDQSRVMTPAQAHKAGADFLVIGRPITSLDSLQAMREKAQEINESIFG